MIIKSLQAKNHLLGWELEEITFDTNPTLLVGLSGVGKTQILQTIYNLKRIIEGKSVNGFEWKVNFLIEKDEYVWEGRFSVVEKYDYGQIREDGGKILFEKLAKFDKLIIDREGKKIIYNKKSLPYLLEHQSLLFLLQKDKYIRKIAYSFESILINDYTSKVNLRKSVANSLAYLDEKYLDLNSIKNSKEDILLKLFLTFRLQLEVFKWIEERIIQVFPQIEQLILDVQEDSTPWADITNISISIKEKGVPRKIEAGYISSGMLRTIIHIAQIYLANDGSIILIDEFENSLGTNCMDILTEDLIHENKNIQFIATSHHPYIINNIPYQYWKIVTRKAGIISAKSASEYKLGKSKQKAFIQLTEILENQYQ